MFLMSRVQKVSLLLVLQDPLVPLAHLAPQDQDDLVLVGPLALLELLGLHLRMEQVGEGRQRHPGYLGASCLEDLMSNSRLIFVSCQYSRPSRPSWPTRFSRIRWSGKRSCCICEGDSFMRLTLITD